MVVIWGLGFTSHPPANISQGLQIINWFKSNGVSAHCLYFVLLSWLQSICCSVLWLEGRPPIGERLQVIRCPTFRRCMSHLMWFIRGRLAATPPYQVMKASWTRLKFLTKSNHLSFLLNSPSWHFVYSCPLALPMPWGLATLRWYGPGSAGQTCNRIWPPSTRSVAPVGRFSQRRRPERGPWIRSSSLSPCSMRWTKALPCSRWSAMPPRYRREGTSPTNPSTGSTCLLMPISVWLVTWLLRLARPNPRHLQHPPRLRQA